MPKRTDSQRIGSLGQQIARLQIEQSNAWISRAHDEDFGIDLEAELADPNVQGEILKIQVKSTTGVDINSDGVLATVEAKYLRLATSLRVPLVFVIVDVGANRSWYVWLQGWLVEQRRRGKTLSDLGDRVVIRIPVEHALVDGLQGDLQDIAQGRHEYQVVLSLIDAMRAAVATENEEVLFAVTELIGVVDEAFEDFPLELLIETLVAMSTTFRGSWELSAIGRFLIILCRRLGGRISKKAVVRMVIPTDGWSRTGLNALGALYDEHEDHIRSLELPAAFEDAGYTEVAFYCRLRQKYPGIKALALAFGKYEYRIGDFVVDVKDVGWFLNKYANRGESVYIDYLMLDPPPPQG